MLKGFQDFLIERMLVLSKQKKRGQIVILGGGAGSGKGYVINQVLQGQDFKVIDVDRFKQLILHMANTTDRHPEMKGMDLKNPDHVFKLHEYIKKKDLKNKYVNNLLKDHINKKADDKPNLIFDITMKDTNDILDITKLAVEHGYSPTNIHVIYVLTNFATASERNNARSRRVPDEILFRTHQGAPKTFLDLIHNPMAFHINGKIAVIVNNHDTGAKIGDKINGKTVTHNPKSRFEGEKVSPLKSYDSLVIKEVGQPPKDEKKLTEKLHSHIREHSPLDPDKHVLDRQKQLRDTKVKETRL